jgi:tRNA G18 (ribose-2'-O)-methylase SpoU
MLLYLHPGVEQTNSSIPLQDFSFPKCCVLLLGNEQNGIPVELLPLLEVCLEIPMLGVTRSLNAHVSGAMVVWQYTQQQQLKKGQQSS